MQLIKTFEDYTIMRYFDDWECLLGTDSDGKTELLNTKGEKISNEAFVLRNSFYPCVSGVTSDYFDVAAEGMTMMVVTHEMAFAREVANRVLFFSEGNITEEGKPEDVFGHPKSERLQQFLASVL